MTIEIDRILKSQVTAGSAAQSVRQSAGAGPAAAAPEPNMSAPSVAAPSRPALWIGGVLLLGAFGWAYASTLGQLVHAWNTQPDYSHGFFVPLLALFFLWIARDRFPGVSLQFAWAGLAIVVLSTALRIISSYYHLTPIDGWSIPLWLFGVVWMLGGWQLARWALPAILFLYFMIPLPFRMETWLSLPLQTVATKLSVWLLQCLGQPAIAQAHTIHLGMHRLEVAQACSGLRMLVGITALAVAYTIVFPKAWWIRALLLASVLPVALAANAIRIAATGLLYQYVSGEAAQKFTHDFAGWAMILLAVALFGGVLWYLNQLFPEQEVAIEMHDLLRMQRPDNTRPPGPS